MTICHEPLVIYADNKKAPPLPRPIFVMVIIKAEPLKNESYLIILFKDFPAVKPGVFVDGI